MDTDVLIVGAGPTGMTLANELLLAGVSTVLVDKLSQRSDLSKAGGVQSRTLEALDQRGLLEPLLATGDHPDHHWPLRWCPTPAPPAPSAMAVRAAGGDRGILRAAPRRARP